MGQSIDGRINELLDSRKGRHSLLRTYAFAAALLAFAVVVVLIDSGVAANTKSRTLNCHLAGPVAHTHNADCYDADSNLICTLPEQELHTHDDSCYSEVRKPVCGQEESDGHQHSDACYDDEGNLICGMEESEGHHHTDDCYGMVRELTCGKEELTEEHVHGPGCFETTDDDAAAVAKMPAQEFTDTITEVNEDGEEEVVLTVAVKAPKGAFLAGTTMKIEDLDDRDEADQVKDAITAAVKESNEDVTEVTWLKGVDIRFFNATGRKVEPAKNVEVKITHDKIRDIEEPILARTLDEAAKAKLEKADDAEVVRKVRLVNQDDEDETTGNENTLRFETDVPATYVIAEAEYVEGHEAKPANEAEEELEEPAQPQTFAGKASGVSVTAVAPAGALPEGAVLAVTSVEDESALKSQLGAMVAEDGKQVDDIAAVSIGFTDEDGNELVPAEQVQVSMASSLKADAGHELRLMQVSDEPTAVEGAKVDVEQPGAFSFESSELGSYAVVDLWTIGTQVIADGGETYNISVTYGPESGIPEDATLEAREIVTGTDEYGDYLAQAAEALQLEDGTGIGYARFFDVNIYANGQKIEPTSPVEVEIKSRGADRPDDVDNLQIVHFADAGTEVIEPTVDAGVTLTTVTYQQGSFSVIGEVTTTKQNGFPTTNGQHVIILQSGEDYYALKKDMTLTKVRFFNETVSFIGEGTTTTDYINDYLWYVSSGNQANSQGTICDSYGGQNYLDPSQAAMIGTAQRQLRITDGKIYCSGQLPGYQGYQQISLSASDGSLHRVLLTDSAASPVYFAEASSFDANNNETDLFTQEEVESIIAHWKTQMTQEISVDKTAEVHSYDNRIYRVDVTASSADYEISPSIALEFVVDASRSMFFPTSLNRIATYSGSNASAVRDWINSNGDRNQVYFVIQDKNGSATQYAIFYEDNQWKYVDAGDYNPPDDEANGGTAHTRYVGTALSTWNFTNLDDGGIYTTAITGTSTRDNVTRKTWVSRIQYLKQCVQVAAQVVYAVDEDAQIGLIGFNKLVTDYGTYGKDQQSTFYAQLNNISLDGGTNSEGGLDFAIKKYDRSNTEYFNEHYAGRKHVVVLVTDGAPNYAYGVQRDGTDTSHLYDEFRTTTGAHVVTWDTIRAAADRLRGLKDDFNNDTELYTMGLSLANVGTNRESLFSIATDESYRYAAEDAAQIINAVTKMVGTVFVQANLVGDVTDVIDPAFYPVDRATGMALNENDKINLEGELVTDGTGAAGTITKNGDGNWVVEWEDQSINWPSKDDQGHVLEPGWQGTVFVKAKEDFLGGNGISTNAPGSKVVAGEYRIEGESEIHDLPDGAQNTATLDTPFVNVDELALNYNETEWTVYLGEEVDPLEEVKALWDNIKVVETVTKTDDQHRIATDGSLKYSYSGTATNTTDSSAVMGDEQFLLSSIVTLTEADWTTLLSSNDAIVTKYYSAYGHTGTAPNSQGLGRITVMLRQEVVSGEKDLSESPHATEVVGQAVEKYTLSVRYTPAGASVTDWHTGSYGSGQAGSRADTTDSINTHVINVIGKKLQLRKIDSVTNQPITSGSATFVLYVVDDEEGTAVEGLPTGHTYRAVGDPLVTATTGDDAGWTQPTDYLPADTYWLVETVTPDGYISASPMQVTINVDDFDENTYAVLKDASNQPLYDQPIGWNWEQQAVLNIANTSDAVPYEGTAGGANETEDITVVQYDIKNSPGVELPAAGGSGVKDLYATGVAMVAGALAYLIFRRKIEA